MNMTVLFCNSVHGQWAKPDATAKFATVSFISPCQLYAGFKCKGGRKKKTNKKTHTHPKAYLDGTHTDLYKDTT